MEDKNKNIFLEEHLRKIKYRTDYKINESPKYRPLVIATEEFDNVPDGNKDEEGRPVPNPGLTAEAGDQENAQKQGMTPREPSNAYTPEDSRAALPEPEAGVEVPEEPLPPEGELPIEPVIDTPEPDQEINTLQNDIIKHNVEAMKSIQSELEGLTSSVQGLNTKLDDLNADIEEVREPTNAEKLMSKKNVSYPYYFNLNDFWDDNWFDQQRENDKGIRELPDGTFIADFDDLPQKSKMDIQDSFNELV